MAVRKKLTLLAETSAKAFSIPPPPPQALRDMWANMIVLDGSPKGKEGKVDDKRFFYNLSESRIGFGSAGCDTIYTIYLSQRTQSADPNLRILISVIHFSFSPLFYAPQSPLVPIQIPPPPELLLNTPNTMFTIFFWGCYSIQTYATSSIIKSNTFPNSGNGVSMLYLQCFSTEILNNWFSLC